MKSLIDHFEFWMRSQSAVEFSLQIRTCLAHPKIAAYDSNEGHIALPVGVHMG